MITDSNRYWKAFVLIGMVVTMVACGNSAPTALPTSSADPTNIIQATESIESLPTATMRSSPTLELTNALPTVSQNELTQVLSVVQNLVKQTPIVQPSADGYTRYEKGFVKVDFPDDWSVSYSDENRLFLSAPINTEDGESLQLTTINVTLVSDLDEMQSLRDEGLLEETATTIGNDNVGKESVATTETNQSAEFGTSYLQFQRAVFVGTKLILVTGKTTVDNAAQFRPIFDTITHSIQP